MLRSTPSLPAGMLKQPLPAADVHRRSREFLQVEGGVVPGVSEAGLQGRSRAALAEGEGVARNHFGPGYGRGEGRVVAGQQQGALLQRGQAWGVRQQFYKLRRGTPVRLREHKIQGYHGRSSPGQGVHQRRQPGARPGPLPETDQGLVVQVHHPHRRGRVDPRREFLKAVEDYILESVYLLRSGETQQQGGQQHEKRDQIAGAGRQENVEPGHFLFQVEFPSATWRNLTTIV